MYIGNGMLFLFILKLVVINPSKLKKKATDVVIQWLARGIYIHKLPPQIS